MLVIPIAAIPNQSFAISVDENFWEMALRVASGTTDTSQVMFMDIVLNGTILVTGQRVVAGWPILPYQYLENGNFAFFTLNGDLPDYTKFGVSQNLIYASESELIALRANGV